ncbi:DNA repair protein RecO [Crenothrix polyspora]|uniref:DNA repair protein RecO n=1 Tax=Crenothrix polyspora TaxID=360316 RepID=A0A1R4H7B5_9GAMM|nr:DNA repair protein RecO [Crenothrix polyspora]SJM92089.1 DNA repair protein RecO [Crenothrix polyspora]
MICDAVYEQAGFILKQRQYRETSLIIDVFTQDFGRVTLLAKGVRKAKSKSAALLQPFTALAVSYVGCGELKILTHVDVLHAALELNGLALYCGFYISELILCLLHQYDPHPDVFNDYNCCLSTLASATALEIEWALRLFEINLIEKIGYGLQLEYDFMTGLPIDAAKNYAFNIEKGPYEDALGYLSGVTLQVLHAKTLYDAKVLSEAKLLMRRVIDVYLQGRPLKSRQVMNQIIKRTHNV